MDTASNKTDEGSCEEAKQTNKKEVKVAAKVRVDSVRQHVCTHYAIALQWELMMFF